MKGTKKIRIHAFCNDALGSLDGIGVAEKISSGKISATEAVESAIKRARKVNPGLNAIVAENFDGALEEALNRVPGPFSGVPSFLKDTESLKGMPKLFGSRGVPAKPARRTDRFVKQFLSLGFICLGKTTLPEFGLTATTEPLLSGVTRNPWNPEYSTGGSSGGSAALVAAGVVPLAHGNDGGGSIRIPAACCGLVGLKPTRGRLHPVHGSDKMPVNIIHQGVLTRTVRDTAAFYAGAEKYYRNPKLPDIGQVRHPGKKRLRIAMFTDTPFGTPCHPEVAALVSRTARLCEELGHTVEDIPCPCTPQMTDDFIIYWGMMAFSLRFFGRLLVAPGFDRSKLEDFTVDMSRIYQKSFRKTVSAIRGLRRYIGAYNEIFNSCDILLNPTLAHPVPKIGYLGPDVPFEEVFDRLMKYVSFTPMQNVSGAPAISLPLGLSKNGVPLGVQFGSAFGRERELLEFAFEIEEASPWPLITDK
ncbi:MAG TPA: amidase [Spirochaetota bacterium]|nr:amidase [Spirochaetota bacterium]